MTQLSSFANKEHSQNNLLAVFLITITALSAITLLSFPSEVLYSTLITVFPWFLAGFVVYWFTIMIIVEQTWFQRVLLLAIGYGFVQLLSVSYGYNNYANSWPIFTLLGLFSSLSVLVSGHRFRRGVR